MFDIHQDEFKNAFEAGNDLLSRLGNCGRAHVRGRVLVRRLESFLNANASLSTIT